MESPEFDISVIIPSYNRCAILERCLAALITQTMPAKAYEIVVCDDGSADQTRAITESFAAKAACSVVYLFQPNAGANAARNRGVTSAKGRLLLIINDDTIAVPDLLRQHKLSHDQYPEENIAILGRMTISPEVPPSFFAALHLDADYDQWQGKKELDWRAFYTCNVSVKRSFLLKYGLFEEGIRYHEDLELSERLSHHGLKIIYNPAALGYHYHHLEETEYLNAAKKDGKALARWYLKFPHLEKVLVPFGFHLTSDPMKRAYYILGDLVINRYSRPLLLKLARWSIHKNGDLAKFLYWKLYASFRREAINEELKATSSR